MPKSMPTLRKAKKAQKKRGIFSWLGAKKTLEEQEAERLKKLRKIMGK